MRHVIITVVVAATAGCQTPEFSRVYGITDYVSFHGSTCRAEITDICVEIEVTLPDLQLRDLVAVVESDNLLPNPVAAIRLAHDYSRAHNVPALEFVSGSYSTVNGQMWGASEDIAIFALEEQVWVHKDTATLIYDPV